MKKHKDLLYIEDFGELFVDVQNSRIFTDQKTFVDCHPKYPAENILSSYQKAKQSPDFDLKDFVTANFEMPKHPEEIEISKAFDSTEEYIDCLWSALTKTPEELPASTLIPLPEKFVVPGGRFREIFYWDSYFTMLGLQVAKKVDLIESMINNFAYLIDRFGFIPNGNQTYFLSRSQPPFFSLMVELLSEEKGNDVYLKYLPQLEAEYSFWMKGVEKLNESFPCTEHVVRLKDGEILNRYWDEMDTPRPEGYMEDLHTADAAVNKAEVYRHLRAGAESGWDFSSRWFENGVDLATIHTADIVALDLNCLLVHLEQTLAKAYQQKQEHTKAKLMEEAVNRRASAIHKYLWHAETASFGDYNFKKQQPTFAETIVIVYPLAINIATEEQARAVKAKIEDKFLQPGGLLTTLIVTGQQWDAPNGWAPMQWMAFKAAINYGQKALAEKIRNNWITNIDRVFQQKGMLMEKYNVVNPSVNAQGGEYPNQYGFGWTNGVYLKMKSTVL